ncbi:COMM domain [Halocaridina rubra]|uniref:COMM domain n=1 Tax=Halocaridina rubra TaxID=373956 RepID=A0AAN8ZY00_HALRR
MDFITVFNTTLKLLERENRKTEKSSMIYYVDAKKNAKLADAESLCTLLESIIQENTTKEDLQTALSSHGLQKEHVSLLVSQLERLKELVAKRRSCFDSREEVIDLQWKFGVVAGSSVGEETGRTFVQVKLLSRSPNGATSSRHIEMSLEKFYDFLHQLEKAKASLEYIRYM